MPFDNQSFELDVAAAGGPFAKVVTPTPATDDVILRILIEGRARIEDPVNWIKHALTDGAHAYCVRGALFGASKGYNLGRDGWPTRIHETADDYLEGALPARAKRRHQCPASFNNDDETTHADVLALFDRAIAARRSALVS